ncbi:transcription factor cmr1 protein [Colletotrichum tofieldiae]|nr:transcription factor cmr1 protein [Colletotrichum tofieldiae]GKT72179.1 transcription factor cmr1 protein [Colletotrichum tofieldiae]
MVDGLHKNYRLEQQFAALTKEGHVEEAAIIAVFDQLKPIPAEFMLGKWDGFGIDTGHPSLDKPFKWAGKDFRSLDDVDPVMVWQEDGKRTWNPDFGHAQVREIKYRGVVTAGMIYDNFPSRVRNQSTTSTTLINILTSIHVNVNPRGVLLRNQSINAWGCVD